MAKSGAAFSLPIPLDAFKTINECMERVYGTGDMRMSMQGDQFQVLLVSEIARKWFDTVGGINYVETKLTVEGAEEPEFVFTMQRLDGLTPADKAEHAEARVAELEQIVSALEREIKELAQGGDG